VSLTVDPIGEERPPAQRVDKGGQIGRSGRSDHEMRGRSRGHITTSCRAGPLSEYLSCPVLGRLMTVRVYGRAERATSTRSGTGTWVEVMNHRELLRSAIAGAVGAVRRGDEDDAFVRFGRLGGSSGLTLRDSVLELAGANVEMLMTLVDGDPDDDALVVLADEDTDGEPASIDDAAPAQRATTRVLLALANGHQEDAELQLDIVAAADPDEMGQVFAHTMSWTLELLDRCTDAGRAVPGWLRPVLT
jgi:hypothetical protein